MFMSNRVKIFKIALGLFSAQGIRNVTVDELARAAGMSKRTVYTCFNDKAELVDHLYRNLLLHLKKKLRSIHAANENSVALLIRMSKTVLSSHRYFTYRVVEDLRRFYSSTYQQVYVFGYTFLPALFSANITTGIKEGLYRPEFNSDIMGDLAVHQLNYLWHQPERLIKAVPQNMINHQFLQHLALGLTTPAGEKLARKYFEGLGKPNEKFITETV
jgi:AcrR family transcriptional regulator